MNSFLLPGRPRTIFLCPFRILRSDIRSFLRSRSAHDLTPYPWFSSGKWVLLIPIQVRFWELGSIYELHTYRSMRTFPQVLEWMTGPKLRHFSRHRLGFPISGKSKRSAKRVVNIRNRERDPFRTTKIQAKIFKGKTWNNEVKNELSKSKSKVQRLRRGTLSIYFIIR